MAHSFGFECFLKSTESFSPDSLQEGLQRAVKESEEAASVLMKGPAEGRRAELERLIACIDLTTLSGDDTRTRVEALVDKALAPIPEKGQLHCASICIYPARIADAVNHLHQLGKDLPIASVAGGFPSGQYPLVSRLLEISWAVKDGATEIDSVINRAAALDGDWETVYDEIRQMRGACAPNIKLKMILAVGDLKTPENIYKASWAAMLAGSDMIKTSTGKEATNASLEAAYLMCMAIRHYHDLTSVRVGFKPAGGIQQPEEALAYRFLVERVLGAEWLTSELFRIGASSLLDKVVNSLQQ